jgi:hypothetical protein
LDLRGESTKPIGFCNTRIVRSDRLSFLLVPICVGSLGAAEFGSSGICYLSGGIYISKSKIFAVARQVSGRRLCKLFPYGFAKWVAKMFLINILVESVKFGEA